MKAVKVTSTPVSAGDLGVDKLPEVAIIGGSGLYDPESSSRR